VKIERIGFQTDPARYTAGLIVEGSIDPVTALVVSPTQRFKTYLASALLRVGGAKSTLSPRIVTNSDLMMELLAYTGKPLANAMEKLTLLFRACEETEELSEIYPRDFLNNYGTFVKVGGRLLRSFEELAREEIELADHLEEVSKKTPHLKKQMQALNNLWNCYRDKQDEAGAYDASFLLGSIGPAEVLQFFHHFSHVFLISPLSLTRFEQRLFSCIEKRLTVIYQDAGDYDFSRILTFRRDGVQVGEQSTEQAAARSLRFYKASSRMEQVLLMVSLIKERMQRGADLKNIAVINSDAQTATMLFDMLTVLGIEANYTEGLQVALSPLYQFILLVSEVFKYGLDSDSILELLHNAFFIEITGDENREDWRLRVEDLRGEVLRKRIFSFSSLKHPDLQRLGEMREALAILQELHKSKDFSELYSRLEELFFRLSGRKTYDYYVVKDAILDRALELHDLQLPLNERPLDMLLQSLNGERYALQGVYARGVQILGLLESRAIGFETVIVPTFNEGCFPKARENDILLPSDIRGMLDLPTLLDREELGFYYLKRVVDSAQDVSFITLRDSRGEIDVMSRYAYLFGGSGDATEQTVRALPVWNTSAPAERYSGDNASMSSSSNRFSRMDVVRLKGCETQYYIASKLGIYEYEELQRQIEPSLVGQQVHRVFTDLYRDVNYDKHDTDQLENKLKTLIDKHFREGLFFSREEELVKKMLGEKLLAALRQDLLRFQEGYRVCPDFIEKTLEAELSRGRYSIWGRIDRVDKAPDGSYSLIDYKTGYIPKDRAHFEEEAYGEVQLGFYGLLLKHALPGARIESLSYFDVGGDGRLKSVVHDDEVSDYLEGFETHLVEFLDRFNEKQELSLAADLETCTFCPYDVICRINET
jgi:RecB family exonuclease